MDTEPKSAYLDDEERELIESIERDDYEFGESALTPEHRSYLEEVDRNTLNEERQKISLRVLKTDLARLKVKAMRDGIPYQNIINSLIHRHVT